MGFQPEYGNQIQRPQVPQVYNPPGYPVGYPSGRTGQTVPTVRDRLGQAVFRKKLMTLVVSALILVLNDVLDLGIDRQTIAYLVGIAATFILGQGIADMGKERAVIQAASGMADHVSYEVEVEDGSSASFSAGGSPAARPMQQVPPVQRVPLNQGPLNPQQGVSQRTLG